MSWWRERKDILASVLALPLLACGGVSSSSGPVHKHQGGGVNEAGTTSTAGGDAREPVGTEASGSAGAGGVASAPGQVDAGAGGAVLTGGAGTAGEPGQECRGEACQLSVDPTPRWVTKLEGYGRGAAQIRFSDAATVVSVGVGEQDYYVTALTLATGEVVGQPTKTPWVVAADRSGRRMVTALERCVVFIDGTESFRFDSGANKAVRFSSDGSVISNQYCVDDAAVQVEAYDTASGQLIASARADMPCFYGDLNVLVDAERGRTLFGHPQRSELFVFDWATQTIETRAIHHAAPVSNHSPFNREGTILNLSSSPDGQQLVSVGAADGLAWLEPDSMAVQLRIPDVPFFNVYDECYTTYLDESPVAWSPAGELFATARPGGGVVLRATATQEQLAVLDPPKDPEVIKAPSSCSSEFGPVLMEFSPDMRSLVVLYPGHASAYSLSVP